MVEAKKGRDERKAEEEREQDKKSLLRSDY